MVSVTYIWHDCFVVETDTAVMVFDYWKDLTVAVGQNPRFLDKLTPDKPLYVFVSHHHKDHFVREIFDWSSQKFNIHYIISKDVAKSARHILSETSIYNGVKPDSESVTVLKPGESYNDGVISVEAFGSTDIGNSYFVKCFGMTFFHAGDLNAWIWKDESTPKEVAAEIRKFEEILKAITSVHPKIDYVMFPVDNRIGTDYYTGAKMFAEAVNVGCFFPMHFGLGATADEDLHYRLGASATELYANRERGEYVCLMAPYANYSSFMP